MAQSHKRLITALILLSTLLVSYVQSQQYVEFAEEARYRSLNATVPTDATAPATADATAPATTDPSAEPTTNPEGAASEQPTEPTTPAEPTQEPTAQPEESSETAPAPQETEQEELEEEKTAEDIEREEIERIEEEFDDYANADTTAETQRLQEAVVARTRRHAELHLLEPLARKYESRSEANNSPCGPSESGATHWMGSQGSRNYFTWRTLKSHHNANCTMRISSSHESTEFKLLRPLDDSADYDGKFPCGRHAGFEGKEIKLPLDLICDTCVLQLTQDISAEEKIHQCADIVILEKSTAEYVAPDCIGKCQNGGVCQNGGCQCREGFEGEYCGTENANEGGMLGWIIVFTIMIGASLGLWKYGQSQRNQL